MSRSSGTGPPARARVGALVAACSLLAGCAWLAGGTGGGDPTFPTPTLASADGSSVVLRVEDLGGFVDHDSLVTRLPALPVHADGRAIRHLSLCTTSVDGLPPLLPVMVQSALTPAGLDAPAERFRDAGVGDGTDLSYAPVVDASTTRFFLDTGDGPVWSDVSALRESAGLGVPVGEPVPSPCRTCAGLRRS